MAKQKDLPNVQVHVVIPGDVAAELDKIAESEGISRSDVVRRTLIRDVRHNGLKDGVKREA